MKSILFGTSKAVAPLLLRIFLAVVIFPHGAQKLMGWFDGGGFNPSMEYLTVTRGLPWPVGLLVILIEFFGPLAILMGFATRLWSIAIAFVMLGVLITTFHQHFFMDWYGTQKTEGMQFFLLVIGMSVSLVVSGAGRYSVDAAIDRKPRAAAARNEAIPAVR